MIGDRVLDRFTLGERLGEGGFGVVHRAWDERLNRPVAVKILEGGEHERVLREAQAVARLNHPGIVTLYEMGEQGSRAFLVSELVEGATLRELVREGRLRDRDLAEIGAELCAALEHAHQRGVVHRDIKPENVIVRPPPAGIRGGAVRAKLMDFGIAEMAGAERLTRAGQVVGTIAYMAPEQAEGERVGPAADVYALALTLYECWAGANPVAARSPAATARRIGAPVPPLADERWDLPPELTATIDACLAPDPAERPEPELLGEVLARQRSALSEDLVPEPADGLEPPDQAAGQAARAIALLAAVLVPALLLAAGLGGAALVGAAALVPAAILLAIPAQMGSAAAAPLAGAAGLGAAFPALAALPAYPSARAAVAVCGWIWAVAATIITGTALAPGLESAAEPGWAASLPAGLAALVETMLRPAALALAALWIAAALALGAITDLRRAATAALAAMVWAATTLALTRLLDPVGATATLTGLVMMAAALAALVNTHGMPRLPGPRRRAGGELPARRPPPPHPLDASAQPGR